MASLILLKSMLYANALEKTKKKKKVKLKKSTQKHKIGNKIDLGTCRICSNEKGVIPIFNNMLQPNIPDDIEQFGGVTLNNQDNLPSHMCQNCLNLLNGCIMFRELCQRSNKLLIEMSIKKELINYEMNETNNGITTNSDDDDDYNIPSPSFSDNSELWSCGSCNKDFSDMVAYNNHLHKCNKETNEIKPDPEMKGIKSFLCDICGKTARSKGSLLVHMGTHENVFPFKCDECPYQGRTRDLLTVHKRSHLVDKPYKCSQCPKATTTASNLAKHMRHVHSTTRPFKCTYCDKAFSYQHDMKRHVKDIHLRQGTVDCDVCYKKFNTKKILQGHRWKVHKIKGERSGRLPSYLQYQNVEENDNNASNCDLSY